MRITFKNVAVQRILATGSIVIGTGGILAAAWESVSGASGAAAGLVGGVYCLGLGLVGLKVSRDIGNRPH